MKNISYGVPKNIPDIILTPSETHKTCKVVIIQKGKSLYLYKNK